MGPAGLCGRSRANPKSMIFTGAPGVSSAYRMFCEGGGAAVRDQPSAPQPSPAVRALPEFRAHLGLEVAMHHARLLVHEAHGRHEAAQDLARFGLAEVPLLADVLQQLPAPQQLQNQVRVQLRAERRAEVTTWAEVPPTYLPPPPPSPRAPPTGQAPPFASGPAPIRARNSRPPQNHP